MTGLAARSPVRLAAQAPGSDLVGGGLGQPVAGGRLAAVEAVPGRVALEFVRPLLEGEFFRIALGEFRRRLVAFHHDLITFRRRLVAFHYGLVALRFGLGQFRFALGEFRHRLVAFHHDLITFRRRLVAFHHGLVALRFGLGQFRFVLGDFLSERGTRRTLPGTIVRARSDEFGSPPAGAAETCAGYGGTRNHDSHIEGLESISTRNIEGRTKYYQIVALMPHIWPASGANSVELLGRWDRNDLSSY